MYNQFPDARILRVDLTNKEIKVDILPGEIYRLYPGGSALGLYLAMQDIKPGIDPLYFSFFSICFNRITN